jgi:hypothetical protein
MGEKTGDWFTENPEYPRRGGLMRGRWKCPYGARGTKLWVREPWAAISPDENERPIRECKIEYKADTGAAAPGNWDDVERCERPDYARWKPSIHMPRWASRITLEITGIKVERLQDISEEDAKAEGVTPPDAYFQSQKEPYTAAFADLWREINGSLSWAENPFVWAISFRRIEQDKKDICE